MMEFDESQVELACHDSDFDISLTPEYILTLYNQDDGSVLDIKKVTASPLPNRYTFNWTHHILSMTKGNATKLKIAWSGDYDDPSKYGHYRLVDNVVIYTDVIPASNPIDVSWPTNSPTEVPSGTPTATPTKSPAPSISPSKSPSTAPSSVPSTAPSKAPTPRPTFPPTTVSLTFHFVFCARALSIFKSAL